MHLLPIISNSQVINSKSRQNTTFGMRASNNLFRTFYSNGATERQIIKLIDLGGRNDGLLVDFFQVKNKFHLIIGRKNSRPEDKLCLIFKKAWYNRNPLSRMISTLNHPKTINNCLDKKEAINSKMLKVNDFSPKDN